MADDEDASVRFVTVRSLVTAACAFLAGVLLWTGPVLAAPDVPASARGRGAFSDGEPSVEARLLVDASAISPDDTVRVGVLFELAPSWHIYWRNPGEAGFPTTLDWKMTGVETGPLRWPGPHVYREAKDTITVYGYTDSVLLYTEARLAESRSKLDLAVEADFLVCKLACVPGRISLNRSIPVAARTRPAERETRELFDHWAQRVPTSAEARGLTVDALYSQSAIRPGDSFRAAISLVCDGGPTSQSCSGLRRGRADVAESFIPGAIPSVRLEVTGTRKHPFADGLLITMEGRAVEGEVPGDQRLHGVVQLHNHAGEWVGVDVDLPLPRAAAGAEIVRLENPWLEPEEGGIPGEVAWWRALLFALLGGLILNLMPCVLPVLAIKVFGIAERAHADRRDVLLNGGAYTLGILATMCALAGVVIALRTAGTAVGWGFQFQEPLFVVAISTLILLFALNLFGVFEIGLPGRISVSTTATGVRGSFFEGLLVVLLATPCSAPFLGTAVGFAFASSAPVIVGIFLAIGLGLAAPFVAITLVPGLARLLPRSGPWMVHLRAGLGTALLVTLVWLLWVVGRLVGTDGLVLVMGFLLATGVGVWIYGVRQRSNPDGRAPVVAAAVGVLAIAALFALPVEPVARSSSEGTSESISGARRFDPAAIQAELANGRPVFVYFTADWCLTCKVNERMVLRDARVADALVARNVATFEADWTLRDDSIRAALARFGRAGVPLYLIYDPDHPASPELLPELLTVDFFLDALRGVGA